MAQKIHRASNSFSKIEVELLSTLFERAHTNRELSVIVRQLGFSSTARKIRKMKDNIELQERAAADAQAALALEEQKEEEIAVEEPVEPVEEEEIKEVAE